MKRAALYSSEEQKVRLIERNLVRQYNRTVALAREWGNAPRFSSDVVRELHGIAMQDIYACAGQFRKWSVRLSNSLHIPGKGAHIQGWVEDLCEMANDESEDPLRIAAFVLWTFN